MSNNGPTSPIDRWMWFEDEVKARGFVNFRGVSNKGQCRTADSRHFLLLTDGLVIYSTCMEWDRPGETDVVVEWGWFDFSFEGLDEAVAFGEAEWERRAG